MDQAAIMRVLVRTYAGGGGARAEALLEAMTSDRSISAVARERGIKRQSLEDLVKRCKVTIALAMKSEGVNRDALAG